MTQQQYIDELRKQLAGLDPQEIDDAIAYCKEYFEEAKPLSDEQIIQDLGSPEALAQSIRKDAKTLSECPPIPNIKQEQPAMQPPKKTNKGLMIGLIILGIVAFLGIGVLALTTFFGFSSVQHVLEYDSKPVYENELVRDFEPISDLNIETDMANLEIRKGNTNRVIFKNLKEDEINFEQDGSYVSLEAHCQRNNAHAKVIVELADSNPSLTIRQSMGEISFENRNNDIRFTFVDIELSMGDIELSNVISDSIKLKNNMGDIEVDILGNEQDYSYYLKNNMGDTEYENFEVAGSIDQSGGNASASKTIEIENDMGEISVEFN